MKNLSTFFLIVLLSMVAGKASADVYDALIDGIYYSFNGDEAFVTKGTKYVENYAEYTGRVVIPESVTYNGKNYKVTKIMEKAFYHCTKEFIGVEIPNTIISIGKSAFSTCDGLTAISIPNSVKTIEANAFEYCKNLKTVSLGNALEYMGDHCFYMCENMLSTDIPNTVSYIGESAFGGCSSITSINVPSSLTTIIKSFTSLSNLTTVIIPNSVTSIGNQAFAWCYNLKSITIPSSVTSIHTDAFIGCKNISEVHISDLAAWLNIPFAKKDAYSEQWTSTNPFSGVTSDGKKYRLFLNGKELSNIVIPESIVTVPAYAFYGCKINSVTMHNAVTEIASGAFSKCGEIESVVIPNSVTNIGDYAFDGDIIQSLTIGSGVLKIGNMAFYNSSSSSRGRNIKKTIWLTNTPPSNFEEAAGIMNYVSNSQYRFNGNVYKTYIYPLLSSMFAVDGVKYVPTSMADRTCEAIDAVYDESAKLTKLGTTTSYRNVKFTVNYVRPYTCCGNTFIENVELTDLPFIEDYVFDGCTNLRSAKLPETVAWLGLSSFQDCASLQEIAIPAATTEVKHNSFKGCSALKNVTMKDGNSGLNLAYNGSVSFDYQGNINVYNGTPLFEDCPLYKVYIGRNITYGTKANEGYSPFYRNTSLRSVEITDQETEIGENEFYGCSGLKKVKIGDGVTTFGNWAFSGCSSLDYFEFGSSVKTIGKEAFSDCSAVTNVISHTAVPPTCGSQAMDDISKWDCTLTVPDGTIDAYAHADQWKEFLFAQEYSAYLAGVDDIRADSKDCRQKVFSLSGQRLTAPRKGLNIIGGRKIIVK